MNRLYCHLLLAAGALNQMSLCLADAAAPTAMKGVYAVNGRLHVNLFGAPEGDPITTGPGDMKPSWSKTGNKIVFFRMSKYTPDVSNWKNAIHDCFLLTPGVEGNAKYEPVKFSPPQRGMADRISISPSETKICCDFQKGFGMNQYPGRTIYIADFDVAARTVSNPVAISDLDPNHGSSHSRGSGLHGLPRALARPSRSSGCGQQTTGRSRVESSLRPCLPNPILDGPAGGACR